MKKHNDRKLNILMCTVVFLLCATLFSIHFTSHLYARYTTKVSSSDGARVAKFNITQEGTIFNEITANVTPGKTQSVDLIITNDSEVAVEYTLKVTNVTRNLQLTFKLEPVGGNTESVEFKNQSDNVISTNSVRQIPGYHKDTYKLNIVWEPGDNGLEYIDMVDYITVSVTVTQID